MSESDRQEIVKCFVIRLTSAIPGGPRAAEALGEQRVQEVASEAGRECGKEFGQRMMASEAWTPAATFLLAQMCKASVQGATPAYCACFAREVPKRYISPATFKAVNESPSATRSPRERARIKAINEACVVK
jgi:hypothetical protein